MEGRGGGWWPEEEPGQPSKRPEEPEPSPERPEQPETVAAPAGPPRRPPRGLESRDRPKVASRYSLYVGVAFIVIVIVAVLNAFRTDESGLLGPDTEPGLALAQFAVPDVRSELAGDANIADDDCESSRNPCPTDQVRLPACEIETEGAIRVCDLFDKPLAISFWFTRGGDCLPTQDAFDRVARKRRGEVNFLSVNVLDDREAVEELVRERGWELPVGHDADGAVSNIYRVGVCPTVLYAYPGGILHAADLKPGNFSQAEIEAAVEKLVAASERRERGA